MPLIHVGGGARGGGATDIRRAILLSLALSSNAERFLHGRFSPRQRCFETPRCPGLLSMKVYILL